MTARVVDASASREAIAELVRPRAMGEGERLYRLTTTDARPRRPDDPEPPRRVVTIHFLSN